MALIAIGQNRKMEDYLESVRRAGGEPVEVVVGGESPEQVLARVDGLVLTGGGDVDPKLYGEARHDTFQAAEDGRDDFEIALARAAIANGIPLLAICRGMQVLNVAMGGTLVQDIPSQVPGALAHAVPQPRAGSAHPEVAATSRVSGRSSHAKSRSDSSTVALGTGP